MVKSDKYIDEKKPPQPDIPLNWGKITRHAVKHINWLNGTLNSILILTSPGVCIYSGSFGMRFQSIYTHTHTHTHTTHTHTHTHTQNSTKIVWCKNQDSFTTSIEMTCIFSQMDTYWKRFCPHKGETLYLHQHSNRENGVLIVTLQLFWIGA